MENAPLSEVKAKKASLSDAKRAYFEGDFERCIAICEMVNAKKLAVRSELALLQARAFLRCGDHEKAERAILNAAGIHPSLDAAITADMLLASAYIRQNDADRGLQLALDALRRADRAHPSIRSELAFTIALGYWAKRDVQTALEYLNKVEPKADIIYARALELHAWCYSVEGKYAQSAEYFRRAVVTLDTCRANDAKITITALCSLALFAAELFDGNIAAFVERRLKTIRWQSSFEEERYEILENRALFAEFSGNTHEAYRLATEARHNAPSIASKIFATVLSSSLADHADEYFSARAFSETARVLLETLDIAALMGEGRFTILAFAQSCAHFHPEKAHELFLQYQELKPLTQTLVAAGDRRIEGFELSGAGAIARAQGDTQLAERHYRKAFAIFRSCGYLRRAVMCAHAIIEMRREQNKRCDDLQKYIARHLRDTDNYITRDLTRLATTQLEWLARLDDNPIFAALPDKQQLIVRLMCQGKSNKEISIIHDVQEQTIKNIITRWVFPAFGVTNRIALINACLTPSQAKRSK